MSHFGLRTLKKLSPATRVFLAGLAVGAIGAASHRAFAFPYRVLPAQNHCQKDSRFSAAHYECGLDVGSDFPAASFTQAEIDFNFLNAQSETFHTGGCRESWNQVIGTCSAQTTYVVTDTTINSRSASLYPGVSVMQGGSAYDYRSIYLYVDSNTTSLTPKGLYLTTSTGN